MSLIELLAAIFGFICVYFSIREHVWCWPAGITQVFLYIFVFYEARLYSDVLLHVIFIFISCYGWYKWMNGQKEREKLEISKVGTLLIVWIIICLLSTICLGYLMATYTDASLTYADAFIAVGSLIAQWLMTHKKLESWWFWIFVDIVAIWVYMIKDLYITTGLYTLFLIMACLGYLKWKDNFHQSKIIANI